MRRENIGLWVKFFIEFSMGKDVILVLVFLHHMLSFCPPVWCKFLLSLATILQDRKALKALVSPRLRSTIFLWNESLKSFSWLQPFLSLTFHVLYCSFYWDFSQTLRIFASGFNLVFDHRPMKTEIRMKFSYSAVQVKWI